MGLAHEMGLSMLSRFYRIDFETVGALSVHSGNSRFQLSFALRIASAIEIATTYAITMSDFTR